ncbi:MAG: TIGR03067 domain-containing protein [Armatimonadetes bacterium]|nr:TIGR03067 domain-containing protein [Armatimonadota bacterium]
MDKQLPPRPNLDHLRRQAKALLADLAAGSPDAAQAFVDHLPAAARMTPNQVQEAGFRLADAHSVVARSSGFATWPALARHVASLRSMEGTWEFVTLEVDGNQLPPSMLSGSRILMDGDRFRTESPEADYEGVFTIDVEADPATIDIEFVAGPEAGNWSYGIFELDGDDLRICLGLTGAVRPTAFETAAGRAHALETLRRSDSSRPVGVDGGTAPVAKLVPLADTTLFEGDPEEELLPLQGEWQAVQIVRDGMELPSKMRKGMRRTMSGREVTVTMSGQVIVHALVRALSAQSPVCLDYCLLDAPEAGQSQLGIMEMRDAQVRFCFGPVGGERPDGFEAPKGSGRTLSVWRPA